MVSLKETEGEFTLLKQNNSSDQLKNHQIPPRGIRTNLYCLGAPTSSGGACGAFSCNEAGSQTLLDVLLLSQWEDHSWKGQLRYDITTCEIKIVCGGKKFIAQLNEKCNSSSLMELEKKNLQPLSTIRFSFQRTLRENILLCVSSGEKEASELVPSSMLPKSGILVVANENPVEYGHIFLVPYDVHQIPQFLDKQVFGLVMRIAAEVHSSSFRAFFDHDTSTNSDHNYFQACYFANPLPVELLPTISVYGNLCTTGIQICQLSDYPLNALVFMSKNWRALVEVVGAICSTLHDNGTAFSLLICDSGMKMFLFPQDHKLPKECHLSAWECGGFFVYHKRFDFDHTSEVEISKLMASVSLDERSFQTLKQLCSSIALTLKL